MLAKNHDFLHVANLHHIADLVFVNFLAITRKLQLQLISSIHTNVVIVIILNPILRVLRSLCAEIALCSSVQHLISLLQAFLIIARKIKVIEFN